MSIDCGGKANHLDENNITWVTYANYIDIKQTGETWEAILPHCSERQERQERKHCAVLKKHFGIVSIIFVFIISKL